MQCDRRRCSATAARREPVGRRQPGAGARARSRSLGNHVTASRADETMARDFAYDMLQSVEPYGILITAGDNDTFPLWYAQEVEGVRPGHDAGQPVADEHRVAPAPAPPPGDPDVRSGVGRADLAARPRKRAASRSSIRPAPRACRAFGRAAHRRRRVLADRGPGRQPARGACRCREGRPQLDSLQIASAGLPRCGRTSRRSS